MKKTVTISPFNRVEGDLEIKVDIKDSKVTNAHASGVMFRGFEKLLRGRDPMDALVFTCRICGICGLSHSTASSNALRNAFQAQMPPNAYFVRNIVLGTEVAINHPTHFYALFNTDLINAKYQHHSGYEELVKRFAPLKGISYIKALRARRNFLGFLGLFAGKWPNSLVLQPGGTTRTVNRSEIIRAMGILAEFKTFVEENLLGCSIERWLENKTLTDLQKWLGEDEHENSDLGVFIKYGQELGLDKLGNGPGKFLACGGYELSDGSSWLKSGCFDGRFKPFDQGKISEHIKYSWLDGYDGGRHPLEGVTEPNADKPDAYSWAKAPRYDGNVVEVGPLARMTIDEDPLALSLLEHLGPSVYTRNLMRIHETTRLLRQLEIWLSEINPDEPFYIKPQKVREAKGIGLTEAARGVLGHWIHIEEGRIKNYQVTTPTAWNVSPRDSEGTPGVVEQALIGTPVEDEHNPIEVAHVIRSFDPCLFCTVHAFKQDKHLQTFELTPA